MLTVRLPESASDIVEAQRRARGLGLGNVLLGLLALAALYRLRVPPGRGFGWSVKAMTSDAEFEVEERRTRLAVNGHGESFRVCAVMKASRSASVNILRGRFLPLPMLT
jgi:hypothetical protein